MYLEMEPPGFFADSIDLYLGCVKLQYSMIYGLRKFFASQVRSFILYGCAWQVPFSLVDDSFPLIVRISRCHYGRRRLFCSLNRLSICVDINVDLPWKSERYVRHFFLRIVIMIVVHVSKCLDVWRTTADSRSKPNH